MLSLEASRVSGFLLGILHLGGGFGHPNGSTKVGRETTSRSKSELLTSDSVDCPGHSTESGLRSSDFDREVVSRPTFVLPLGCPESGQPAS